MKNIRYKTVFSGTLLLFTLQIQSQPIRPAATKLFNSFGLDEVCLHDRKFRLRQEFELEYIKTLEPDKYLSHFRRNAGVETDSRGKTVDNTSHYRGWESMGSSTFGHYLSALSMMYKVTGDTTLLHKINYIIDELDFIQRNPGYKDENLKQGVLVAFDRDHRNQYGEFIYSSWTNIGHIKVNGKPVKFACRDGAVKLAKRWKAGDVIEVELPLSLRKEYMPGCPDRFAFFYGPVLLAGKLGKDNMPGEVFARCENDFTRTDQYDYKGIVPEFQMGTSADDCLKKGDSTGLKFVSVTGLEFIPFYEMMEECCSVYWKEK